MSRAKFSATNATQISITVLVAGSLMVFLWLAWQNGTTAYRATSTDRKPVTNRPVERRGDEFVSSDSCKACHPSNYHTWHASYHRTMTQLATPQTVLAPFAGEEIHVAGYRYRFHQKDNQFWVGLERPAQPGDAIQGNRFASRMVMMTGSHHYQAYWLENGSPNTGDNHNIWLVPAVYLIEPQQWVPRVAAFLTPARAEPIGNHWNKACIKCHSTHGVSRYWDAGGPRTWAAEFGISCESCHGPGERHVALSRDPLRRYRQHFSEQPDDSIVNPARLDHRRSSQVCGQCHSFSTFPNKSALEKWVNHGFAYRQATIWKTRGC